MSLCERRAERECDDDIVWVLGGAGRVYQYCRTVRWNPSVEMAVAGTYIADNALVEGVICDTMDLRRSVMVKMCVLCLLSKDWNYP